jgi:hypothetical protein
MRWFYRMLSFVTICEMMTKESMRCRPRNPRIPIARFDAHAAFRARMNIFKSGISGSDVMCWFSLMLCRDDYKNVALRGGVYISRRYTNSPIILTTIREKAGLSTRGVSFRRLVYIGCYLCNKFATWLQIVYSMPYDACVRLMLSFCDKFILP